MAYCAKEIFPKQPVASRVIRMLRPTLKHPPAVIALDRKTLAKIMKGKHIALLFTAPASLALASWPHSEDCPFWLLSNTVPNPPSLEVPLSK
jgi:hypothetical protein